MSLPRRACQALPGGSRTHTVCLAKVQEPTAAKQEPELEASAEQAADLTHCVNWSRCHTVRSDAKFA